MNIGGLQPFTLSDYPGCCAAIIFTIGCNFRCPYCHNKSLWNNEYATQMSEKHVFDFLTNKQDKLEGVVITGGEPTIQPDLERFAQKIKMLHYKVKLDTNGSHPNIIAKLINNNLIDYIAMDIKAPLSIYHKLAGVQVNISNICSSINLITNSNIPHIFRTTWDKSLLTEKNIREIKLSLPAESVFILQNCKT